MLNRLFVVDSVTLTSTGTAVSTYTPWDQTTRKLPTQVVVKATGQGAYVRLSNDNSAATNADVLVQGGDHVVLSVQGRRWVSVLSDGASSTVNVGALSTGVSGSAASLDLVFVDAGVLDPRVTFTRASTATYFNSAGVLTSAAINAPRFDYDPLTLAARGLLIEEQRTNLLVRSEDFGNATWDKILGATVATNTDVAPDGNNTADRATIPSGGYVRQLLGSITAGASYAVSLWVKKPATGGANAIRLTTNNTAAWNTGISQKFTLTSTWQRVTATGNIISSGTGAYVIFGAVDVAGNADADCVGDVLIWGAQTEAGAFPTSYIPTTTTALTRSADVASVNTLSPWYNATEGTLFAEVVGLMPSTLGGNRAIAAFSDNTYSNTIFLAKSNGGATWIAEVTSGGPIQASYSFNVYSQNATARIALAYQANNFNAATNGTAGVTDTSGTVPAVTKLELRDATGAGGGQPTCYLRRITYYPRRLSNAELQAITA